jgi:PAT family beta-lactamase induction signal transducer AmpG
MGPMVGPLFVDLGLAKETIGSVRLSFGLVGTLLGITCGGLSALRLGFNKTLLVGAVVGPGSNLMYAALALVGASTPFFAATTFVENFSEGFAGAALVAYMSSLTSLGYTATQYALLSSFYALLGKVLKGFSGQVVEALTPIYGTFGGYSVFFAMTAAVGIPAVILCLVLTARNRKSAPATGEPVPAE